MRGSVTRSLACLGVHKPDETALSMHRDVDNRNGQMFADFQERHTDVHDPDVYAEDGAALIQVFDAVNGGGQDEYYDDLASCRNNGILIVRDRVLKEIYLSI